MTGPEHYREAEALLGACGFGTTQRAYGTSVDENTAAFLTAAQVHATLALAATTAASDPDEGWDDIRRDGGS